MTNSEKLLSSFSENYFYKELVYADLKFTHIGGTEIELADLIINLEDIILAIQLKERNEKDRTQDKNIEEKWLKKKCKKAKEQIKDTIVEVNELNRIIEEAVLSLPEKCGEVFRKSREEHLSNQEIAKEMQISVKTVEAQITKALKMIRKYLGETYSYIW